MSSVQELNVTLDEEVNVSDILNCPLWTENDRELVRSFEYWVGGVAVCCLSIPGMLLNIIAICLLSTRVSIQTTFNSLLISLFTMDSFYLLFETLKSFRTKFHIESRIQTILLPKLTYPLTFVSLSASIFMTVAVAHERYVAIKKPIQHRQSMRSSKFQRKKSSVYILLVILLAFGFNAPKFLEVELKWQENNGNNSNNTRIRTFSNQASDINTTPMISVTDMRKDPSYSIYYISLCRLVVLGIIPFTLLTFYNYAIYKNIRQTSKSIVGNILRAPRRNQENELARVLFVIVGLCIVCHAPRFCLNFYEMFWINNALSCINAKREEFPPWSYSVQEFSRLLMILNSTVNSVIYCCFNNKFRRQASRLKRSLTCKFTSKTNIQVVNEDQFCDNHVEMHSLKI